MKFEQEYLLGVFKYYNGKLFWDNHPRMPSRFNGKLAGYTRKDGYVYVKLNYTSVAVHKIIWCMLKASGWNILNTKLITKTGTLQTT